MNKRRIWDPLFIKKTLSIKWTAILLSLLMLMTMVLAIGVTAETTDSDVLYTQDNIAVTGKINTWANAPAVNYTHSGDSFTMEVTMAPATAADAPNVAGYVVKFGVGGVATEQITIWSTGVVYENNVATAAINIDLSVAHTLKVQVYKFKLLVYVDGNAVLDCMLTNEYTGGKFTLHSRSTATAAANTVFTNFTVSKGTEWNALHYEKSITPIGRLNTWSLAGTPNYTHTGNAVTFETTVAPKTATDGANTVGFIVKFGVGVAEQQFTIANTSVNGGGITAALRETLDFTKAHTLKVQVYDTDVAVFIDGKPVLNYTLAAAYTGGRFALHSKSSASAIATSVFSDVTISTNTVQKPISFFAASALTAASSSWGKYNTGYTYSGKGASLQFSMEPMDATAAETVAGQMLLFVIDGENWQFVIEPTMVTLTRNNGGTRVTRKARETDLTVKNNIRVDIYNNYAAIWINDEFILRGSLQEKEYTGGTFTICSKAGRSKVIGLAITESPYQNDIVATTTVMNCTTAGIRDRLENNCQGLRFFETLNTTLEDDGTETVTVNDAEYTVNEVYVLVSTEKYLTETLGKTVGDLTVGLLSNGQKVKRAKIEKYRSCEESSIGKAYTYSALLTNIPKSAKDQYVCARTYLECTDAAGNTVEIYGVVKTTSVQDMYNAIIENDPAGSGFKNAAAMKTWMEVTADMINNRLSTPATKIASEKSIVWCPQSSADWTMSQHASVAVLNGKVYVTWSNARTHEDDCGQRVMYSYTSDFKTWSEPQVLPYGQTEMGQYTEAVKMNGFMHSYNGTLYASFSSSEWLLEDLTNTDPMERPLTNTTRINHKLFMVSTTDGVNWKLEPGGSAISSMGTMVTNRFFNVGSSNTIPYTDDPTGLTGWRSGTIAASFDSIKEEYGISLICEGAAYQTADGVIRAMWRTDSDYILMAESYDNGLTFTRPYMTQFTNGYSMFKFGYLPDNRIFCIYNPTGRERLPLSIVLSEDGINFNKEYTVRDEPYTKQYPGIGKGGHYSYPSYCVDGDYLYIAYALQKEAIEVTRIKISDLK